MDDDYLYRLKVQIYFQRFLNIAVVAVIEIKSRNQMAFIIVENEIHQFIVQNINIIWHYILFDEHIVKVTLALSDNLLIRFGSVNWLLAHRPINACVFGLVFNLHFLLDELKIE